MGLSMDMPDAKSIPEGKITQMLSYCWFGAYLFWLFATGAQNILRAFAVNDFPSDPEQIFLTSWGEWWPTDVYALALDKGLQKKWCLSREEIEKAEGLAGEVWI
jgi:hypothetical protein